MFEAVEGDAAEGLERRHLRVERCYLGAERRRRRAGKHGIAAFGLAGDHRPQGERFLQGAGEGEDVAEAAADQFEFGFADGGLAALALDAAAVDGQFDLGFAERHDPDRALEIGGEYRHQPRYPGFQPGAQLGVVDMAEIEHARAGRGFPFAALRQPAAGGLARLDGEQPLHALLAEAQGDATLLQFEIGRVVVGVEQVLALRLDAGQQGVRCQLPGGLRRQLELELDFGSHARSPSVG